MAITYKLLPQIETFFRECVVKPYEEHEVSETWTTEVTKQDWRYHTNIILDRGRTDFRKECNGLSQRDKIILYCYYYMQMHTVSGYHTFRLARKEHKLNFLDNILFVDFGCGPLTSAVSLAWHNLKVRPEGNEGLQFRYVGIDISKHMLSYAKKISDDCGLFHADSVFEFVRSSKVQHELPRIINEHREASGGKELTVVLNCSYYFASRSLNVAGLTTYITELVSEYLPNDKVCLVFQNPDNDSLNETWEQFKKGVKGVLRELSRTSETIYYYDVTRQRTGLPHISLRREYLLNDKWLKQSDIKRI